MALDYSANPTTFAHALRLTRLGDGEVFGFTEHDEPASIGGVDYTEDQGLTATSIIKTAGSDVGTLEITTLNDGSLFEFGDILGGIWNNAEFLIFRYNWADLSDGTDELLAGSIGEIQVQGAELKIELRDLRQPLQQDIGNVCSKTCRYRFGSNSIATGGFCNIAPTTVTGTVTGAAQDAIVDTARTEPNDFFGEGEAKWLTGNNLGQRVKVKNFSSFTLNLVRPMFSIVQVGDQYQATEGCRKTRSACIAKGNILNFGGEPDLIGINSLTESPV